MTGRVESDRGPAALMPERERLRARIDLARAGRLELADANTRVGSETNRLSL